MSTCKPHQIRLSVTGTVAFSHDCIFSLQQHLIIFIHQDGPKGMIAVVTRGLSNGNGCSEMSKICIVHDSARY
jgi:hypothetical protein